MTTLIVVICVFGAVALFSLLRLLIYPFRSLDLSMPQEDSQKPSLFSLISQQVEAAPDKPLDYSKLPHIIEGESGLSYAPGTLDAIFGGSGAKDKDWMKVKLIILAINANRIDDWRIVEQNLVGVGIAAHDKLADNLRPADVTPQVVKLFWEVARNSSDYDAVKWGVSIGTLDIKDDHISDLLVFARHGEFTLFAAHAIIRESARRPALKKNLLALLPVCRQWAVIQLINHIVVDDSLISDRSVQRQILIYGMENNDGIPMEIALTIAKAINLSVFSEEAYTNQRIYEAIVDLMNTLVTERHPLGGLRELPDGESIFDTYVRMLEQREPDIRVFDTLEKLEVFLADEKLPWQAKNQKLAKVKEILKHGFSIDVVRAGLLDDGTRSLSLRSIRERKIHDLLPEVLTLFKKRPDSDLIQVLSKIGKREHLQVMLDALPKIVDLSARREKPLSQERVSGPGWQESNMYAGIISGLGRLATPDAVSCLKQAVDDYDPSVRSAACEAFALLPEKMIDDKIKKIITERVQDPTPYVAKSAEKAARRAGIQ
jgi:hypothetical protein